MLGDKDCGFLRGVLGGKGTNVSYGDLARVLQKCGWNLAGSRGSHRTWRKPGSPRIVLVDAGSGPVLPVYAKHTAQVLLQEGVCKK